MTYEIESPTGNKVTTPLSDEQLQKIQQLKHYKLTPVRPRISISDSVCTSCEG